MSRISLHNHKFIDTEERPLILNIQFKEACERIKAGEKGVKEEILQKYSLVQGQLNLIDQLLQKQNNG